MNKKYLAAVPVLAILGLSVAGIASAHGLGNAVDPEVFSQHFTNQINADANLLGITVDEMKADWAAGKSVRDIAKEKGISDTDLQAKMQAARDAQIKAQFKTLVDKGFITQAQADARLTFMQNKNKNNSKKGFGRMHGMPGRGGWSR